jgi:hypothetical protein
MTVYSDRLLASPTRPYGGLLLGYGLVDVARTSLSTANHG